MDDDALVPHGSIGRRVELHRAGKLVITVSAMLVNSIAPDSLPIALFLLQMNIALLWCARTYEDHR